jgi:hypothetical protein
VILPGSNDFVTMRPDVASQWCSDNDVDPSMIGPSADIEACWVCPKGHHWPSSVRLRTKVQRSGGSVCSVCSNRIVIIGINDMTTTHPKLAAQVSPSSPWKATEVPAGTKKKLLWICSFGHEWPARGVDRVAHGDASGCSICSGRTLLIGFNDFATICPELANQWHPSNALGPSEVLSGLDEDVEWLCEQGHSWWATPMNRRNGSGCHVCTNRIVVKGVNDLQTTHPMIAKDWHPGNPKGCDEVTAGTVEAFAWICEHDHAMHVPVARRVRAGGCSDCVDFKQSRVELEIWSHLEDLGHDVSIGVPIGTKWRGKIDAALVEGRIAIEYDGSYWHSREGSAERDLFKTRAMLDAGWTVIRLRAGGLGTLDLRHEAYFELDCAEGYGVDLRAIAEELSRLIDEKRKQPLNQRLLLV